MSAKEAQRIVQASIQRASSLASLSDAEGRKATRELLKMLKQSDARIARKLAKMATGGDLPFTVTQAHVMRSQMRVVIHYTEARLLGLTETQAMYAVRGGVKSTAALLEHLEMAFTGIRTPLRIRQAAAMNRIINGTRASLLAQHETSVARYGKAMVQAMERRIRNGILDGKTTHEVVDSIVKLKGPKGTVSMASFIADGKLVSLSDEHIKEGLFVRYRSWAERIVRTETANAYEEANMWSLYEARGQLPDLKKKILAVFDNRTADDSKAVHGQVRDLEGYFQDGAGRSYQRPPGRPNDRETMIPWRAGWKETPATKQKSASYAGRAIAKGSRVRASERAQVAISGAVMRHKVAREGAAGLRADQAKAAAANRRGRKATR